MIKKLLMALVVFSFLIGSMAFAGPDYKDGSMVGGVFKLDEVPSVPVTPLKPAADTCDWQDWQCSAPFSIYLNAYGGVFTSACVRFSPTTAEQCTLDEAAFYIYDGTGFGYPLTGDLVVTVWGEDPAFPDYPDEFNTPLYQTVIDSADLVYYPNANYVTIPGVTFQGEDIFVDVEPVDVNSPLFIMGEENLTTCASSPGSCTSEVTGRSLSYYTTYGYRVFLSACGGTEAVNYSILAHICCEIPTYSCPGNQEWPTFQKDYARSGYTTNTLGDLTNFRKLWEFQGDFYITWGHPIIADELVYVAFYDQLVCLDLYTGSLVWSTLTNTDYAAFMQAPAQSIRVTPTFEDGKLYFGTGAASFQQGFVCADAYTGDTIWVRHPATGDPLEGGQYSGETKYSTSVIVGDYVYFGTTFGFAYGLDKLTGDTYWYGSLPLGMFYSPSTDGTDIFVATSDGGAGTGDAMVYRLDGAGDGAGGMSILASWGGYDDAAGTAEYWFTCPVYSADEDALYVNGALPEGMGLGTNGVNEGLLMKLNASDLTPIWPGWNLTMDPQFVTPTLMPYPWETINVGGGPAGTSIYYFSTNASLASTRQFTFGGSLTWSGMYDAYYDPFGFFWDIQDNSMAATCDPYLFAGYTLDGWWRIINPNNGDVALKYHFSDYVLGNALAEYADKDYVITTTFASAYGNGYGKVFCFDIGPDRPRLNVPELTVTLPSVSFLDPDPQYRSADLFENIGSADMNYTITLDDGAKMVDVAGNGGLTKYAQDLKNSMVNRQAALDEGVALNLDKSRDNYVSQGAPDFVTIPAGDETGILAPGAMLNQEFTLTPSMMTRGNNPFYVLVDTDDPDYNPEDDSPYPHADPQEIITVVAVKGYDFCDGYVNFGTGTNTAYFTNAGWQNNAGSPSDAFMIDDYEAFLYHHSFFYAYEEAHIAWQEEAGNGINHFEPNSACTAGSWTEDLYASDGSSVVVNGDVFSATWIDSLKDKTTGEFDPFATIGMEMTINAYGGFDDAFANFTYTYFELQNRGNDPLPADLYWGAWADWDVASYLANVGVGMVEDGLSAYRIYDNTAPNFQYGIGTVPLAGNIYPAGDPTTGAYNSVQIANDPYVYDNICVDSLWNTVDECAAFTDCYYPGTELGVNPGQDMSAIITGGKIPNTITGNQATFKGGFVMFGFTDAASPQADITEVMNFANKFAGFGRGDVNNDNVVNIVDLCLLNSYVNCGGNPPYPFVYLGDVDGVAGIDQADVDYLFNYLFMGGDMPIGDWIVR